MRAIIAFCAVWFVSASSAAADEYEVLRTLRHDAAAFAQGLVFQAGKLYESTGRYGSSSFREVDAETGEVLRQVPLPERFFGEGLACLGGSFFQLTWRSGIGFVFEEGTLKHTRNVRYEFEGWGLTEDGEQLIASDGSATLRYLDPETFEVVRELEVRDEDGPVEELNELEWIDGHIFSNVWHSDEVVKISPESGRVVERYDFSKLMRPRPQDPEAVLNGLAWDETKRELYVTGKLWPTMYVVRLAGGE